MTGAGGDNSAVVPTPEGANSTNDLWINDSNDPVNSGDNDSNSAVVPSPVPGMWTTATVRTTRWRCGRYPHKRCYKTMRSAEWAAAAMRRREVDAHLVNIFECPDGPHLHVGHRSPDRPVWAAGPPPEPLTHSPVLSPALLARLGLAEQSADCAM